jgi:electron transport complex protein RnfB
MTENVYQHLARHLDSLPGGFPSTESGVEMRILRKLFTEEEATMAVHLTMRSEPVEAIANRAGLEVSEVENRLEQMAKKGLIFRRRKDGAPFYSASQYVIGIWEYQVNNLDPELIRDMNEYIPDLVQLDVWQEVPQLRTIPVSESIDVEHEILPYEEAERLVLEHDTFAVAPCICRREHKMAGEGCDRPEEVCLIFGSGAEYYIENGFGRSIDSDEALSILHLANETGLVLQPSNSKHIVNICCCCGCCCQVLLAYKRHPAPASLVSSPFRIAVETELCIGCGDCLTRCQMDALSLVDDLIVADLDRCIGCGLCVTACTSESLHMVRKPEEIQSPIPTTLARTYLRLARVRGMMGEKA